MDSVVVTKFYQTAIDHVCFYEIDFAKLIIRYPANWKVSLEQPTAGGESYKAIVFYNGGELKPGHAKNLGNCVSSQGMAFRASGNCVK